MRLDGYILNDPMLSQYFRTSDAKEVGVSEELVAGKNEGGFENFFRDSWAAYEEANAVSKEMTAQLLTGTLDDLTAYKVAGEKSSMLFEYNMTVRNKVLDAYQDILKTQV